MKALIFILLLLSPAGEGTGLDLPDYAVKRIDKTIGALWPEAQVERQPIEPSEAQRAALSFAWQPNRLFRLQDRGKLLGYLWLSESMGKYDRFDYMVVFNPDLSVKRSRVLVYREDYGGEISAPRWLAQFEEKKGGNGMEYGRDIQAISGATISCRSICHGIKTLSLRLQELQQLGLLG